MKRILPVLLGALAGAIGLPILMFACAIITNHFFPDSIGGFDWGSPWDTISRYVGSADGQVNILTNAVLGAWSVVLLRGDRTLWSRFGSAICSLGAFAYSLWMLRSEYRNLGISDPASMRSYFLPNVAFDLPLILWAVALFFFAVITRKGTDSKPLLP